MGRNPAANGLNLIEAQVQRMKVFIHQMALAFLEVYYDYWCSEYCVTAPPNTPTGSPRPKKEPRLAKQKTVNEGPLQTVSEEASSDAPMGRPRCFQVTAILHHGMEGAKGVEVAKPYLKGIMDTDGTEDEEEANGDDGTAETKRVAAALKDRTILLKRRVCNHCFVYRENFAIPEYFFWKTSRRVPDDCPRCRRVLFKKMQNE